MTAGLHQRIKAAISSGQPVLIVVAGSNGAGKTTFYYRALEQIGLPFINADEIAKGLAQADTATGNYEAMRLAETIREDLLARRESFVIETVLSDTQGAKLNFFERAQASGYLFVFIHIVLANAELSALRVMQRVLDGGHDVPDDKLVARFPRTRENAAKALAIADQGFVIDNSSLEAPYRLTEVWIQGSPADHPHPSKSARKSRRK